MAFQINQNVNGYVIEHFERQNQDFSNDKVLFYSTTSKQYIEAHRTTKLSEQTEKKMKLLKDLPQDTFPTLIDKFSH